MKKSSFAWIFIIILFLILGGVLGWAYWNTSTPIEEKPTFDVQLSLTTPHQDISIPASSTPKFSFDISEGKFRELLNASGNKLKELVSVNLVQEVSANTPVKADLQIDKTGKKLLVRPEDSPGFKPGKYKLSLKLRTLEGEVNIEQDFTWGVIAVNTNKSIYKPGDVAQIGMGVLNDSGETQCMTGKDSAKVWLTVTSPSGEKKEYSTEGGGIKDSGECAATSVTNTADFNAIYLIGGPGMYKMKVVAQIQNGEKREIEDYFKVGASPSFDVERKSFPTRIYPRAEYPVKFTITAKDDYSGTVEDIMPSDFKISKISGGGKEEPDGDFKKIIWNVHLKKGQLQTFSYTISFPQVSPEFYLIGPMKIGDFQEVRQWQIASDAINSTSGLLAYEDNGGSNTFSRTWSGTAFNTAANIDPNGGGVDDFPDDSRWFVEKSSPKTGEKLVAAFDNCGAPINDVCLWMYRWTGTAWAEEDFVFDNDAGSTVTTDYRLMDIAYEEQSGDALFVYGDGTTQLKYRFRESGTWTGALNAGTAMDSRKKWVKAKGQYNSDNILVGYLNDNERIGALIWDGSSDTFTSQFDDDDSPAQTETATSDEEGFDIAWETQSNTPMIFWGTAAQQLMYREFTGGAWSGETAIYTTDTDANNDIEWVTASSDPDPTSNYIALAMQETFDNDTTDEVADCEFGMWNGSSAESLASNIVCRSDADGRLNNVQFENTGGRAVYVYVSSGDTNSLSYRTWQAGSGSPSSSSGITGDTSGNIESVQLHSDLNTTSMVALTADSDAAGNGADLNYWAWEGGASTWTMNLTDLHDGVQNAGENAEAYGFGFDRNLELMAGYRWFSNTGTVSVSSALGADGSPSTLTAANQQFRLRLLLYYPDSLASSGRAYKLQYVDPGTGTCAAPTGGTPSTWTDVGTTVSPSFPISFYNNTTPADGDNLTGNASLDPTYGSYDPSDGTYIEQDYEESNTFTNSVSAMSGDQVALWDFSLIDNTTYDRVSQTFCFRVVRDGSNLVLKINNYPQINTLAEADVRIQGGSRIQSGTRLQ